jgi:hypothetical protein
MSRERRILRCTNYKEVDAKILQRSEEELHCGLGRQGKEAFERGIQKRQTQQREESSKIGVKI